MDSEGDSRRQRAGLHVEEVSPIMPGRRRSYLLPESIRCGLPANVAAALDSRVRRNILRALHGDEGEPRKLTLRELEADELVERASLDIWPEVVILTTQKLVAADDPDAGEPRLESLVAADKRVMATLTALEAWDGLEPAQAPLAVG